MGITVDVTKVCNTVGPPLPTELDWWQRFVPVWIDVTKLDEQRITLAPSDRRADGQTATLAPALLRARTNGIRKFLDSRRCLDFSDAIEDDAQPSLVAA
jgi:hypothetical protein